MNDNTQYEFLDELLNSSLFLPIDLNSKLIDFKKNELIEELFELVPIIIKQNDKSVMPLFTDADANSVLDHDNFVSVGCEEVAVLLSQNDHVDGVVINPKSEISIGIATESFLDIVSASKLKEFEDIVVENSRPLKQETRFYLREEIPLLKKLSKNNIFTTEFLFNASFKDKFDEKSKYLNIFIFPKGTLFFHVGENDSYGDSIFLPKLTFKLIEENENEFTWKCVSQELDIKKRKSFNLFYVIMAIIILFALFFLL